MAKKQKDLELEIEESLNLPEISPFSDRKKRYGKFIRITGNEVIVDVNGNGERIPYIPKIHDSLKPGDKVEIQ